MRRLALGCTLALLALSILPSASLALSGPEFHLGFKALADQVPSVVGVPLEEEHWGENGDSIQQTTKGLMAWRKADNWTAFTNGSRTWVNGPFGVMERGNEARFEWEAQDGAPRSGQPQPTASRSQRSATPMATSSASPRYGVAEASAYANSSDLGVSWERLIFSWSAIQPGGSDDWRADFYFPPDALQRELNKGMEVVGLLQFTPGWAARNPADGQRSVPKNLSAPASDPSNHWAAFAGRMAAHYKGRIDRWVIWNEPEFRPGDAGAGQSFTWFGSDQEYYMLLKRGYQAIKAANPNASVVFGATSYWVDINMGREPFFKRILAIAASDPEAASHGYFFDAVGLNIYWAPDDILRVHAEMRDAMRARGFEKPIWLTETNAMPFDDGATPKAPNGQRVTMQQQADFAIQALAIAAAAGYQRIGWYRVTDGDVWQEQEPWGLVRDNGSPRPAYSAFKTAVGLFAGATRVSFVPLERASKPWGTPWPQDPSSYYPNWQVYQVVFDWPDGRRVTVLWNATGESMRVKVARNGSGATMVDKTGARRPIADSGGLYVVDLAPASVKGPFDPDGYHYIGGAPVLLVETGVPGNAPIQEPGV